MVTNRQIPRASDKNTGSANPPIHSFVLEDGVSHINIDSNGRTELGRLLIHMHASAFEHPEFGRFRSMEGFWGYIRDVDHKDDWRYISGLRSKTLTKRQPRRHVENFRDIIMEANFYKVEQNEQIKTAMLASTLPFEHYYIFRSNEMSQNNAGILTRPQIASWLTKGFEDIRQMLREDKRPMKPDYTGVFARD